MKSFLHKVSTENISFQEVLDYIDNHYQYTPSAFKNGNQNNSENENQGSAKVLYLGHLSGLSKEETLKLFAEHYQNVIDNPDGSGHQNIRQFIQHGWEQVNFIRPVLKLKNSGFRD